MTAVDYSVIDLPSMLGRSVLKQDPHDPTNWVRDERWYEDIRAIYGSLLKFFDDNGMLKKSGDEMSLEQVVVKLSDLNALGMAFVRTGADERWVASFDRPGSKKAKDDVSYLEKALKRLRQELR